MFEQLDLSPDEVAEVKAYATIEPVGEPMADYSGGQAKSPAKPVEPAKRRAMLRALLPPSEKGEVS